MLVIVPVLYVVSGRDIPPVVLDWIDRYLPKDSAPSEKLVAIGFIVGVAIAGTPLHLFGRYLATVVHELGHSFITGVLGGRPTRIDIFLNTGGLANWDPPSNWGKYRHTLVLGAGYTAPPVAALAAITAVQSGHPQAWFAFSTATLAIGVIFLMRNILGSLWTAAMVVLSYFGSKYLPIEIIGAIVAGFGGYLSIEGIRDASIQVKIIRMGGGSTCDTGRIARTWGMRPRFAGWLHLFLVIGISGYALYKGVHPYWPEIQDWVQEVTKVS